jgi:5-methylcytosine-specific restriction endonuclease McrA
MVYLILIRLEEMMKRKPLISLSDAQRIYGTDKTTFVRPRYVPEGYCEWCGSQIMNKRMTCCCTKEHKLQYDIHTSSLYYANQGSRGGYGNHILRRDNYTCQLCGEHHWEVNENDIPLPTTDGHLDIHHKIYVENGGSDAPDNLITLCRECHKRVHREYIQL